MRAVIPKADVEATGGRRRSGRRRVVALAAAVLLGALSLPAAGCDGGDGSARPSEARRIDVVAAASLRAVMEELAGRYRADHPDVELRIQTGGSSALARRALELDLAADVLFLADAALFTELLQPTWTGAHVLYARDRMVLAYTDASRGAEEIGPDNWIEVVTRSGVDVGMADPDLAPVGYRALMTLRLADLRHPGAAVEERVRGQIGRRNLRPDVAELLAPLQAGALDYAFLYGAVAEAAGLRWVDLPAAIDLGSPDLAGAYARVTVEVAGRGPGPEEQIVRHGAPIVYGAALRGADPTAAAGRDFLARALSPEGRRLLRDRGFGLVERGGEEIVRGPGADSLREVLFPDDADAGGDRRRP